MPMTLHVAAGGQVTGLLPVQVPLWQLSVCVHALPSLHVVPFGAFVAAEHWPVDGSQVPATLQVPAVHVVGVPGRHAPDWQLSPTVHALLSLQVAPLATAAQAPVVIEQVLQTPQAAPLFCQAPFASHSCG